MQISSKELSQNLVGSAIGRRFVQTTRKGWIPAHTETCIMQRRYTRNLQTSLALSSREAQEVAMWWPRQMTRRNSKERSRSWQISSSPNKKRFFKGRFVHGRSVSPLDMENLQAVLWGLLSLKGIRIISHSSIERSWNSPKRSRHSTKSVSWRVLLGPRGWNRSKCPKTMLSCLRKAQVKLGQTRDRNVFGRRREARDPKQRSRELLGSTRDSSRRLIPTTRAQIPLWSSEVAEIELPPSCQILRSPSTASKSRIKSKHT